MRVLMITQRVDPGHDILGFVIRWIEALGREVDHLDVIAQETSRPAWQPSEPGISVFSMGKEAGHGKIRQGLRLQSLLARRSLGARRPDAIFCHMCPEYVVYVAPWARMARVPIYLWYTHGTATPMLRRAYALAERVFTATAADFPIRDSREDPGLGNGSDLGKDSKVVELRHGIDTDAFPLASLPSSKSSAEGLTLLSVGRISPVKNHLCVVRGFARWLERQAEPHRLFPGHRLCSGHRLRIVGAPPLEAHRATLDELKTEIERLGLKDRVELVGAVPYAQIYQELLKGDLLVSASETGSLDKVVLEAMAAGRPVITCNPACGSELGEDAQRLMFKSGDVEDLARCLEDLGNRPQEELEALGRCLAQGVRERHDLMSFTRRLAAALRPA